MSTARVAGEERPVWIEGRRQQTFAIQHEPHEGTRNDDLVIFLNSGLQNRAGPQRIYVETARELCRRGISSLRVDLPGVGDSLGEAPMLHFDTYDPADVSALVDSVVGGGLDRVPRHIALLGLCAGGRVALKAAVQDDRIAALIAWSLPIVSGPADMPTAPGARMSQRAARDQLTNWRRALFKASSWRKHLGSREGLIEGWQKVRRVVGGLPSERLRGHAAVQVDFLEALDGFLDSSCPGLFAFGERDTLPISEFEERCGAVVRGKDSHHRSQIIAGGDHTFTNIEARRRVIDATCEWCVEALNS